MFSYTIIRRNWHVMVNYWWQTTSCMCFLCPFVHTHVFNSAESTIEEYRIIFHSHINNNLSGRRWRIYDHGMVIRKTNARETNSTFSCYCENKVKKRSSYILHHRKPEKRPIRSEKSFSFWVGSVPKITPYSHQQSPLIIFSTTPGHCFSSSSSSSWFALSRSAALLLQVKRLQRLAPPHHLQCRPLKRSLGSSIEEQWTNWLYSFGTTPK